jgi:hypothetical protein
MGNMTAKVVGASLAEVSCPNFVPLWYKGRKKCTARTFLNASTTVVSCMYPASVLLVSDPLMASMGMAVEDDAPAAARGWGGGG